MAGSELGPGIDVHGTHIVSLAARFRVATRPNTLADGLAEMQVERNSELVIHVAFCTGWVKSVHIPLWPTIRCRPTTSFVGSTARTAQ